jgi:hypothetical protein
MHIHFDETYFYEATTLGRLSLIFEIAQQHLHVNLHVTCCSFLCSDNNAIVGLQVRPPTNTLSVDLK